MLANLESLSAAVQRNCHISDALHARDYTLCVYLLKMREYYRWEKGFSFSENLQSTALGDWVTQREQLWEHLQTTPFEPLNVDKQRFDPFDTAGINEALVPRGLVYSGGYGSGVRPHFFLGRLLRDERFEGFTILVSAHEYARDLTAPPAMTLHRTIFVRRESLRRMLWEKVEEWRWRKCDNAMARAIAHYDFDSDLGNALEEMADNEMETVILHEIGEVLAGDMLGEAWHEMLLAIPHSRAEIMVRAVRDNLADCLSTLPALLETGQPAQMHFYFANMHAMRKELSPGLLAAYQAWHADGDAEGLKSQVRAGHAHWLRVARQILAHYRQSGAAGVEALVDGQRL